MDSITFKRQRNIYLVQLQTDIINFINKAKYKHIEHAINIIAGENQILLQCATNTFIFQGMRYPFDQPRVTGENKQLHLSLHTRVRDLVNTESFGELERVALLKHYLTSIFNIALSVANLKVLLPTPLHPILVNHGCPLFDIIPDTTPDQLQAFLENNKQGVSILKQYLAYDLICYSA